MLVCNKSSLLWFESLAEVERDISLLIINLIHTLGLLVY